MNVQATRRIVVAVALIVTRLSALGASAHSKDAGVLLEQSAARPVGTAAISGTVTDARTGRPIAAANVFLVGTLRSVDGRVSVVDRPTALTDSRGRFVF